MSLAMKMYKSLLVHVFVIIRSFSPNQHQNYPRSIPHNRKIHFTVKAVRMEPVRLRRKGFVEHWWVLSLEWKNEGLVDGDIEDMDCDFKLIGHIVI